MQKYRVAHETLLFDHFLTWLLGHMYLEKSTCIRRQFNYLQNHHDYLLHSRTCWMDITFLKAVLGNAFSEKSNENLLSQPSAVCAFAPKHSFLSSDKRADKLKWKWMWRSLYASSTWFCFERYILSFDSEKNVEIWSEKRGWLWLELEAVDRVHVRWGHGTEPTLLKLRLIWA